MWSWFRGTAVNRDRDNILRLTSQLEILAKRGKLLESAIDEQDKTVQELVQTKWNETKVALRRKKELETALENILFQIVVLEVQIRRVEAANDNKETSDAMEQAATTMERIRGDLSLGEAEHSFHDSRIATAEETAEMTESGIDYGFIYDDDLEEELEVLRQKQVYKGVLKTGAMPADEVTSAPGDSSQAGKPRAAQQGEDDYLHS